MKTANKKFKFTVEIEPYDFQGTRKDVMRRITESLPPFKKVKVK